MRDRLTKLILDYTSFTPKATEPTRLRAEAEYLVQYLLNAGVIVPPCKVGQTVYCIRYDKARKPFVKPLAVFSVTVWGKGKFTVFTTKDDCLGVTAFIAREEAEQALAKMKGGE